MLTRLTYSITVTRSITAPTITLMSIPMGKKTIVIFSSSRSDMLNTVAPSSRSILIRNAQEVITRLREVAAAAVTVAAAKKTVTAAMVAVRVL